MIVCEDSKIIDPSEDRILLKLYIFEVGYSNPMDFLYSDNRKVFL